MYKIIENELSLSGKNLSGKNVQGIIGCLMKNPNIKCLDLSNNNFSKGDLEKLTPIIARHNNLEEVNFAGNPIGEEAINNFFHALLKHESPIEKVNFSGEKNAICYTMYSMRDYVPYYVKGDCLTFAILHNQCLQDVTLTLAHDITKRHKGLQLYSDHFLSACLRRKDLKLKLTVTSSEFGYYDDLSKIINIMNGYNQAIEFIENLPDETTILDLSNRTIPHGFLDKIFKCIGGSDFDYEKIELCLDYHQISENLKQYCLKYYRTSGKFEFELNKDFPKDVIAEINAVALKQAKEKKSREYRCYEDNSEQEMLDMLDQKCEEFAKLQCEKLKIINYKNIIVEHKIHTKVKDIRVINMENSKIIHFDRVWSPYLKRHLPKLQTIKLNNMQDNGGFISTWFSTLKTSTRSIELKNVLVDGEKIGEKLNRITKDSSPDKLVKNHKNLCMISGLKEWQPDSETKAYKYKQTIENILRYRLFLNLVNVSKKFRQMICLKSCPDNGFTMCGTHMPPEIFIRKIFPFIFDRNSVTFKSMLNRYIFLKPQEKHENNNTRAKSDPVKQARILLHLPV